MKAVFVNKNCVLRDSHIEPDNPPGTWRLMPATLEAMRLLATDERLVLIWGGYAPDTDGEKRDQGLQALVEQIEAAGGRVDGLISCKHDAQEECKCWGDFPGALWVAAAEFDLQLNECYLLADTVEDVAAACASGARPLMVLCRRSIADALGSYPDRKDYPLATDLTMAVRYIAVEEDISRQLGHPRNPTLAAPADEILYADPNALPVIKATSSLAQGVQNRLRKSRVQLRDMGRWLTFLTLGALGLSLGIAYMLTHLYRRQPFPEFVYWITLQFLPRPLRGALFIIWGIGVIVLAVRSFYRSVNVRLWPKKRP